MQFVLKIANCLKLRNRVEVKKDHNNQKCQLPFKIDIPIR